MPDLEIPEFTLLEVDLDGLTRKNLARLGRVFGLPQQLRIERKIVNLANKFVEHALEVARENSPFKTGELRGSFRIEEARAVTGNFERIARVLVPNDPHVNSREWKGTKPTDSWLAKHLNETGRTAGWIDRAQSEFNGFLGSL